MIWLIYQIFCILLFADEDDTNVFRTGKNIDTMKAEWLQVNKLSINIKETIYDFQLKDNNYY